MVKRPPATGGRWQNSIRNAIKGGMYFIVCFSDNYWKKEKSYINEELCIAIEQTRITRNDIVWLIPVKPPIQIWQGVGCRYRSRFGGA